MITKDNSKSGDNLIEYKPKQPILKEMGSIKRLGIYFFYDADGIVDDYVYYYLESLRPFCQELCAVINGKILEEGKNGLESRCDQLIIRENIGFDSWAYKEAIESYGYDYIASNFDELLLNNYTNFGPIYPFSEMFDVMDKKQCDFWGHNRYIGHDDYIADSKIIDHLQSYFISFRKSILQSSSFKEYWETLLIPESYEQAIAYHELRCTQYFESRGFVSAAYMPWKDYEKFLTNAPVFFAYSQLTKDRSPLLKRKVFFVKEGQFEFPLLETHSVYNLIEFINSFTDYDTKLILQNIERVCNLNSQTSKPNLSFFRRVLLHWIYWLLPSRRVGCAIRLNTPFCRDKFIGLLQNGSNSINIPNKGGMV
ncbi:rhamnan synthesis F family protein [Provencibacterium massiliense]|uniref:rhamnan synthesis F family protein n=1 Tax=Provencibacterium massiliense TaxID=1841868 RepID=UPI0013566E07|nr:rhamnan synthesis F family protein [Provencibacterium massiliense]